MNSNVWVKCKINDICRIRRGASPRPIQDYISEQGIPWVKISDATSSGSRFIDSTNEYIKEDGKEKSRFIEKGTLILSNSATPGIPKIMGIDACVHDGWLIIDEFKNVTQEFLYYSFIYERDRLLNLSNGSVFRNLKTDIVKNYEINLPGVNEQKAIAKVLSDLDEKIETNNKINKKLEEMAQAIFKQWFVDFEFPNEDGKPYKSSGGEMVESELGMIPKWWEVVKLQDIGNLTMGLSPKSESYNAIGEGIPLLNGAADFYGGLIKATKYTTKETRVCKKNDLVFCIRATIGNITFADKEYCLGRGVASIESKKNLYVGIIYMNLSRSIERLKAQATGSVILGLSKPDINDMKLILPTKEILNKYSDIFKNAFDKKHILELENDKLINLRDTLLPKLMSGEIRVPID